jgi:hypothetical protein
MRRGKEMLDRNSLLLTDARVIAEDKQHIVVAVRIPKRLRRENLPLISSALVSSLDQQPRRTRRIPIPDQYCGWLTSPTAILLNWIATVILNLVT